jgi:hypothetical protein
MIYVTPTEANNLIANLRAQLTAAIKERNKALNTIAEIRNYGYGGLPTSMQYCALLMDLKAERAAHEKTKELADKFKWQVRDTCKRAEQAEAELAQFKADSLQQCADCFTVMAEASHAEKAEAKLAAVRELLAVVHRDGGHYTAEHGIDKSVKDALEVYYKLLERSEK